MATDRTTDPRYPILTTARIAHEAIDPRHTTDPGSRPWAAR
ncbi:hypothetical protein [Actinomadura sp. HBU206391]|nr:hypothetical protein [Actinomadura sp. HBU206391]